MFHICRVSLQCDYECVSSAYRSLLNGHHTFHTLRCITSTGTNVLVRATVISMYAPHLVYYKECIQYEHSK